MAMRCIFCSYSIKTASDKPRDKLTRRDKAATEFRGKSICGRCADELQQQFEL